MNRAEYRRQKKEEAKKEKKVYVSKAEIEEMAELLAKNLAERHIKRIVYEVVRQHQLIWRASLAESLEEMGWNTRERSIGGRKTKWQRLMEAFNQKMGTLAQMKTQENIKALRRYCDEHGIDKTYLVPLEEQSGEPETDEEGNIVLEVEG